MPIDGFLLDLDGTLIDSNGAHIEAWARALDQHGYGVAPDRLGTEMGKGGDHLVEDLLGQEAETRHGDALREAHDRVYVELATKNGLPVIAGAEALIAALRGRGIKTALATSSGADQVQLAERASGVRWSMIVDETITSADVKASKPLPDLVHAAIARLGLTAAQCAMLGDTPWDAIAARKAGVLPIGTLFGGCKADTFFRAGVRSVYRDPTHLLDELDEALRIASPSQIKLDQQTLQRLMRCALEAAERGFAAGEVPIGCAIARGDGTVVAEGFNRFNETGNKACHAEIDAFSNAGGKLASDARDTILVSTLEPCVMCTGAAMETAVDLVIYGMPAPADGGTGRVMPPESEESQVPRVVGPVLAAECRALFEKWLAKKDRNPLQEPYVRQLLATTKAGK